MSQQTATVEEQQLRAPKETKAVIDFLRGSKSGLKNRTGVLNGGRREYFKGKSAIKALLTPAYAKLKNVPEVTTEEEAKQVLHNIIQYGFYLRVDRGSPSGSSSSSPKHIQINPMQQFEPDSYYAWFYEGSQWTTYLGGVGLVVVMLAAVMFPLWPTSLRIGVWYLSMAGFGFIGLFIVIAIVRLIFYIITVVAASPGIWIFPKLFADVGFVESFIPVWDWDIPPPKKQKKKRSEKGGLTADKSKKKRKTLGSNDASPAGSRPETPLPATPLRGGARIEEVPDEGDS
ncbi:Translocation protein S62 [Tulasnella sp. 419]|nr:Translocation protein S62 [Tulasnella sp. 418]KAG8948309.1 Translocation protein S62 [Tulasnella sp. 419]